MKRFVFLSIGVLCLMLSALIGFHIGSESAQAQAQPPQAIAGLAQWLGYMDFVMLDNGDLYWNNRGAQHVPYSAPATYLGNFWTGEMGPVPTSPNTWGGVKGKYEGKK